MTDKLKDRLKDLFDRFPLPWVRADWNGADLIVSDRGEVILEFETAENEGNPSRNADVDTLIDLINSSNLCK